MPTSKAEPKLKPPRPISLREAKEKGLQVFGKWRKHKPFWLPASRSLYQRVLDEIREADGSGRGCMYSTTKLAELFGVSRSTMNLALNYLEQENLICIEYPRKDQHVIFFNYDLAVKVSIEIGEIKLPPTEDEINQLAQECRDSLVAQGLVDVDYDVGKIKKLGTEIWTELRKHWPKHRLNVDERYIYTHVIALTKLNRESGIYVTRSSIINYLERKRKTQKFHYFSNWIEREIYVKYPKETSKHVKAKAKRKTGSRTITIG